MTLLSFIFGLAWPWLAAALGAAALPVVIHLTARRRSRSMKFPAARLASQAAITGARARAPRDVILMLLRGGLLAALALACAQPAWTGTPGGNQPAELVIVIDASASMMRTRGGQTVFDEAKRRAMDALAALTPGVDRAAIVLSRRSPMPLLPALTSNLQALRHELTSAQLTLEHGDLGEAVSSAAALLSGTQSDTHARRRIVVLSDMQGFDSADALALAGIGATMPIQWLRLLPDGPASNMAVSALRTSPATISPGAPMRVEALVRNFAPDSRRAVVTFRIPGEPDEIAQGDIPPFGESWLGASLVLHEQGTQRLTASLTPDDFAPDDTFHALLDVRRPASLIVTDAPNFQLIRHTRAALAAAMLERDPRSEPDITVERPASLSASRLAQASCIVLVSPFALDRVAIDALRERMARGRGIVAIAFDEPSLATLTSLASWAQTAPSDSEPVPPSARGEFSGPQAIREAALGLERAAIAFGAAAPLPRVPPAQIAFGSPDAPVLAISSGDSGRLAALMIDPASTSPPLTASPWFPVLIARMSAATDAEHADTASLVVGDEIAAGTLAIAPGFASLPSDQSGAIDRVAVNIDQRESDPRAADPDPSPTSADSIIAGNPDLIAMQRIPLWPWLLLAALALAAVESFIAASSGVMRLLSRRTAT